MEIKEVTKLILGEKYYTKTDLRYNRKIGLLFSKEQFDEFLNIKEQLVEKGINEIRHVNLKTFDSSNCFYVKGLFLQQAQNEYRRILASDYDLNQASFFARNTQDIVLSTLFSEIEGTLNTENIPTTQRHIAEVNKIENPTDENDIIIKNMLNGMKYIIEEKPDFNKENLRKLYNILSKNCLPDEKKIKAGAYYRDDKVYIGDYEGADWHMIDECMNSLFEFANNPDNLKNHAELLPFICHYYILYIHPYFDYNGRTARMVSFWLNYIYDIEFAPFFMSEAINENKNKYYEAITDTRNTNNDLTYFLGYILETSIKFCFIYKNLGEIKSILAKTGDTLTPSEWVYVKKILVHNPQNYFSPKDFMEYINTQMTRQGVCKILNNLSRYGIINKSENKKGETVYKLNSEYITYKYH